MLVMKYADNSIGPQVQQNARKSKTTDSTANRNCFIVIPPLLYLRFAGKKVPAHEMFVPLREVRAELPICFRLSAPSVVCVNEGGRVDFPHKVEKPLEAMNTIWYDECFFPIFHKPEVSVRELV